MLVTSRCLPTLWHSQKTLKKPWFFHGFGLRDPQGHPHGAPRCPKATQEDHRVSPRPPQGGLGVTSGTPEGSPTGSSGAQKLPRQSSKTLKKNQSFFCSWFWPQGPPRTPPLGPRVPKGHPGGPQGVPKASPRWSWNDFRDARGLSHRVPRCPKTTQEDHKTFPRADR